MRSPATSALRATASDIFAAWSEQEPVAEVSSLTILELHCTTVRFVNHPPDLKIIINKADSYIPVVWQDKMKPS